MSTKFDTYAVTTYFVKLAQDAKPWTRDDGKPDDVSLTFADNSRIDGTETLWVDARVLPFQAERARKYLKGDLVQIVGKLRFKLQKDGTIRGKIYDARVDSFVNLSERGESAAASAPAAEASRPAFE